MDELKPQTMENDIPSESSFPSVYMGAFTAEVNLMELLEEGMTKIKLPEDAAIRELKHLFGLNKLFITYTCRVHNQPPEQPETNPTKWFLLKRATPRYTMADHYVGTIFETAKGAKDREILVSHHIVVGK